MVLLHVTGHKGAARLHAALFFVVVLTVISLFSIGI